MKKTIFLLMFVVLYGVTYSQLQFETNTNPNSNDTIFNRKPLNDNVVFGLKIGWNQTNLYGKEINYVFANDKTEYQSGFHAGIYVDTRIAKHFGLKHELLFNQKRIGISLLDDNDKDYKSRLTMSYMELMPSSLTFQLGGLQLYAGPYVSTLLNANVNRIDENGNVFKDKNIFGNPENDETETRYLQKFDFGTNFGIEYQFGFGLSVGARYTHGFTDIFQYANSYTNEDTKTDNIKIYNRGWMVSIGYAFGNSKR